MEKLAEKLDERTKTSHLKNLVAMAQVDGHLDSAELLFLYKIGKRFKLKPQAIADILTSPEEMISIDPNDHENNVLQLFDLVGMMMADGVIRDKELDFCHKMVFRFGFRKELVNQIIDLSKKGAELNESDWSAFLGQAMQFRS